MVSPKRYGNSGVSIVFVMAALIVTGLVGTALLKMGTSDQLSSSFYSSSESARLAARSGVISATSNIGSSNPDTITKMLKLFNEYVSAANPDTLSDESLWLKGGSNSWENLSSSQKYRVRIAAFHPDSFEISLISEGIGAGGSRSEAMAVYDLRGLTRIVGTNTGTVPTNALQMDNGAFEFNVPLIVNGNTSVRRGMAIWAPSHFRGTLRCDTLLNPDGSKEIDDVIFSGGILEVDSSAYFAGQAGGGGANAIFHGDAGFDGLFFFQNADITFDATGNSKYIFAGGTNIDGGTSLDMETNSIEVYNTSKFYDSFDNMSSFVNHTNIWGSISNATVDVATKVGLPKTPPPPIYFDTTLLASVSYQTIDAASNWGNGPKLSGGDLNAIYDASAGNRLGNVFAVVRVINTNSASGIFDNDGTPFTGKMILWVDNARNIVGDYVETSTDANLTIYVGDGSGTTPHFNNFDYARGYIYLNDYSNENFSFGGNGGNCEIDGGVYSGPNTQLFFHGSGTQTISYDPGVISELAVLGIFNNPNDSSTSITASEIVLEPGATRIQPDMLGQAM